MTPTAQPAPSGALEAWIDRTADTVAEASEEGRPENLRPLALRTSGQADVPEDCADDERAFVGDARWDAKLERMRGRRDFYRGKADLQRDTAWLDRLSFAEARQEVRAARRIRSARRRQVLAGARSAQRRAGADQRAHDQIAGAEIRDQIWQRRALSRRARLLDPTSRLAALHRTHVGASVVLALVVVAGIAWTSSGVHDALVGPEGSALGYLVEPLFALPLLVLMAVTAVSAQWGRAFPSKENRKLVYGIEVGVLVLTVALNTFSVLPFTGRWQDATTLLAHLGGPLMILVAVVLQPLVTGFLAEILVDAGVDLTDPGASRMSLESLNLVRNVSRVRQAIAWGKLEVLPETGLPSIKSIGRLLGREKTVAQQVWEALRELRDTPTDGEPEQAPVIAEAQR